jgi:hypothetical protein
LTLKEASVVSISYCCSHHFRFCSSEDFSSPTKEFGTVQSSFLIEIPSLLEELLCYPNNFVCDQISLVPFGCFSLFSSSDCSFESIIFEKNVFFLFFQPVIEPNKEIFLLIQFLS